MDTMQSTRAPQGQVLVVSTFAHYSQDMSQKLNSMARSVQNYRQIQGLAGTTSCRRPFILHLQETPRCQSSLRLVGILP